MKRASIVTLIATALTSLVWQSTARAIPAFARKYETSCVTCHNVFPKLNAFGEAYRLNGYQYPIDDAEQTKDEPIPLGAEGYKRVFPESIWPNDIQGKPPLAIRVTTGFAYAKDAASETEFVAPSLNLMAAGTLGEDVSFYAGAHLFEEGEIGSIDRAFLQISNLFDNKLPHYALNFRVGQFIPNMVAFANHRGIALTPYAYNTYSPTQDSFQVGHVHGGEEFSLEAFQLGIELSGIIERRFRWGGGLVNGSGIGAETNSAKDGYVRAAYKLGGMAFDGSGGTSQQSSRGLVDNAVTLGGFWYKGSSANTAQIGPRDLTRDRFGLDASISYASTNVFGGWITGTEQSIDVNALSELGYDLFFGEVNQMFYPWLYGLIRYERALPDGKKNLDRIVAGAGTLFRANVKFVVESSFDPDDADLANVDVSVDFAF